MQVDQLKSNQGEVMDGPLLITPSAFGDERGWFFESWNQRTLDEAVGEAVVFSQDNHSRSVRGVLRGLHYQLAPEPQAKLVRSSLGSIFDVAVDIRRRSPTFGQWVGAELTAANKSQLWIPEGFAHGFLTLSDVAEVQYKARGFWNKSCERAIVWNDPDIAINWPLQQLEGAEVSLSGKDAGAAGFRTALAAEDVFA
ncbi:MAG: dTDP-4-dehydrorhamnose 3,5-epimerase [Synechococcus sp. CC9902]|nr:MAG: dTDP-4-dehydrorhamnose 3,5-epimerase [Synechococcus sp. CC9902]